MLSGTLTARLPITRNSRMPLARHRRGRRSGRGSCANGAVEASRRLHPSRQCDRGLLLGRAAGRGRYTRAGVLADHGAEPAQSAALLLRATDAGLSAAWMVSTAFMQTTIPRSPIRREARFFLEGRARANSAPSGASARADPAVGDHRARIRAGYPLASPGGAPAGCALAAQLLGSLVLRLRDPTPKQTRPSMPYVARDPWRPAACGRRGTSA